MTSASSVYLHVLHFIKAIGRLTSATIADLPGLVA